MRYHFRMVLSLQRDGFVRGLRISWLVTLACLCGAASAHAADKPAGLTHPRSLAQIKKTLATILSPENTQGDEKSQALQRLKAYRFLAEVPYQDLTLDEDYNKMCLAGARLCEKLGKLEHKPNNPGMPEDEFKLAYAGTSRSNLGMGLPTLVSAVDAWMFDSDSANVALLGHRRWCLNPAMRKTGFAHVGAVTAMYSFDQSRGRVPDFDFICYPARGFMPIEFFESKCAWSVVLNPLKYKTPGKDFNQKIYQADALGKKQGTPLTLDFKKVDTTPFAIPNCIIFRPEELQVAPGRAYVVELEGIRRQSGGTITLQYVVEFAHVR